MTDQTQCVVVRSVDVGSGCGGVTTVTDVNGRTYETVEIGGQCWMAENLASPAYSNGDPLATMEEFVWWDNDVTGAYQAFPSDTLNFPDYGFQYNWYAANDPRNVCPTGWHVPTDQEWEVLTNLHGGGTIAGGPLKSIAYWDSPNTGATNSSGFTALPAGETRNMQTGLFVEVGQLGAFWSATDEPGSDFALHLSLSANFATASRFFKDKRNGISIRCLKDE